MGLHCMSAVVSVRFGVHQRQQELATSWTEEKTLVVFCCQTCWWAVGDCFELHNNGYKHIPGQTFREWL
jgi:hypothetical protein